MPELPDVEIFKRYLNATSLHQRIARVDVLSVDLLKGVSRREFVRRLKGRRFESTQRHGKHLFVDANGAGWLRLHFGMTGFLRYYKGEEKARTHTRVLFIFAKDHRLAFDDQRKFGEVGLIKDVDEFLKKRALGPDALDVDLAEFRDTLGKHRSAVKSVLMNQQLIAGIGNIYADEILFHARIHPAAESARLSENDLKRLFRAMRHVLEKAIEYRADLDRMPKSWLLPYRGKRGKCPRCGRELRSSRISGRTAWFCAHCQSRASSSQRDGRMR
jgi:formamidopyrimidine-DNA glycosylase